MGAQDEEDGNVEVDIGDADDAIADEGGNEGEECFNEDSKACLTVSEDSHWATALLTSLFDRFKKVASSEVILFPVSLMPRILRILSIAGISVPWRTE